MRRYISPDRFIILISILKRRLISCNTARWYGWVWRRQLSAYREEVTFRRLMSWAQIQILFALLTCILSLAALWASAPCAYHTWLVRDFTISCHLPWNWVFLTLNLYYVWSCNRVCATTRCCFLCSLCQTGLFELFMLQGIYIILAPCCSWNSLILHVLIFKLKNRCNYFNTIIESYLPWEAQ